MGSFDDRLGILPLATARGARKRFDHAKFANLLARSRSRANDASDYERDRVEAGVL